MLFPIVPPKDWADLYNLPIKRLECPNCTEMFWCNIPFAMKGYRGFKIETHECGEDHTPSIVIPVGDEKLRWQEIINDDGGGPDEAS